MCVICFFSNLCAVSFHDDVLILLGAVSTPVDDGPYFFNIVNWLVNLPTMMYLSDWEESFHFISFVSVWLFHFFNGSFQVVCILVQQYLVTVNRVGTLECYLYQTCIHALLNSSSICSEGSALQCIFII